MAEFMRRLSLALGFAACATASHASNFGCVGLETQGDLPAIEGKDGVIFRINADLRMYHPFSDATVRHLGALSEALAEKGTTLVYVPIPTKSVTMPDYLPERAPLYGFDLQVATRVHTEILTRLENAGVIAVDARDAMLKAPEGDLTFFKADFHWSARGAMETAKEIANVIQSQPSYAALEKTEYASHPLKSEVAFSGMRRALQKKCKLALPDPVTMTYETVALTSSDLGDAGLDLFGGGEDAIQVALLGTSFSDSPINNFPGFLAEYSQLEVINYAITGGNQFGAMTSYLTSEEFAQSRPKFLIWENPIYNNLAQYGDQPMRELIAAARGECTKAISFEVSSDRRSLVADLDQIDLTHDHTLFLDTDGSAGLRADFDFTSHDGLSRVKSIERGERLRRTGRFYMPATGLWQTGATKVSIHLSEPFGPSPSLSLCPPQLKDNS
ncbi:alginate O-acetyltransferase AlgX-related protein [Shimia sp.]|uniref:alginate O-acetyltransferase AlgX-related protein n=1 Tax=Shimia sp. TaxID=1954381 RepID=UPI003BA87CF6